MTDYLTFTGALMTAELIGRADEQAVLTQAINPPHAGFACALVRAEGGMGKTRLLMQTALLAHEAAPTHVLVLPLIDVADPYLHSVVHFLRIVREALLRLNRQGLQYDAHFHAFNQALLEAERARDGEATFDEITLATRNVLKAFENDYAHLTRQYRVVWVIDTMEQLFATPRELNALMDTLQIQPNHVGRTTYEWLMSFLERRPGNTTVLLAGRPTPGRWVDGVQRHLPPGSWIDIAVQPFTVVETRMYLETLYNQLRSVPEHRRICGHLETILGDAHMPDAIQLLTAGHPIRLALYIDLLVSSPELPDAFDIDLEELRGLDAISLAKHQEEIDRAFMRYLIEGLRDPQNRVVQLLAVMRRGLHVSRLKDFFNWSDTEVERVYLRLLKLSFVKDRNGKLFLHDEFYTMYQQAGLAAEIDPASERRTIYAQTFERIIAFAQEQSDQIITQIKAAQSQLEIATDQDSLNQDQYLIYKKELRTERNELRHLRAEQVHYHFYLDPETCLYGHYYTMAEMAFAANDDDLDALLTSELEGFFFGGTQELNRQQVHATPLAWDRLRLAVVYERVSRLIKLLIAGGQLHEAQKVALYAHDSYAQHVNASMPWVDKLVQHDGQAMFLQLLYRMEWDICGAIAAIFQGDNLLATLKTLTERADLLRTTLGSRGNANWQWTPALRKRQCNVLAQALLFLGYGYATLNMFDKAERFYIEAEIIADKTGFQGLEAEIKNDRSRVLGELGNYTEAERECRLGMDIRKRQGFDYPVALSYNTLSLIFTESSRPTPAKPWAEAALLLFTQLKNPRGMGLAYLQLGRVKRRMWGLIVNEIQSGELSRRHVLTDLLHQAAEHLTHALKIFRQSYPAPAREVAVLDEQGCLYRDWANFEGQRPGDPEFNEAVAAYTVALDVAERQGLALQQLITRVNQAWLYARSTDRAAAEQAFKRALDTVEPPYLLGPARAIDLKAATNKKVFFELGKLYAAQVLVKRDDRERWRDVLVDTILSVTYTQLFADPHYPWYLGHNRQRMSSYLHKVEATYAVPEEEIIQQIADVVEAYRIRQLFPGSTMVDTIVAEFRARKGAHGGDQSLDLSYLDD